MPPTAPTYVIGSINLGDRKAGYGLLADARVWGGPAGRRVTQLVVPGRPGVTVPDLRAPSGPRTLPLTVRVEGATHVQLRDRLAALYAAITSQTVITRRIEGLPDMTATYTLIEDVEWPEPRWDLLAVRVQVRLLLVEGVWAEVSQTTATAASTASFALDMGDAPVYDPVITFPAGTNPTMWFYVGTWTGASPRVLIAATTTGPTTVDVGAWTGHPNLDCSPASVVLSPGGRVISSIAGTTLTYRKRWFA